jgi:D-cysteine desulfhydrase family pyridoxal phosphate-dependent enzyme
LSEKLPPHGRFHLGQFPTPIHRWNLPQIPRDVEVYVKRDDLSGMQLSGNKVRKLEFLLAEAKAKGHDCVITIGGIQSNHCRATAVASRYLGLDCYLILRNSRASADSDPGLVGNLLVERLVGANVEQVTKEEYTRIGSEELCRQLQQKLQRERGFNPYVIPVGGSNALGTWGYLNFVEEVCEQQEQTSLCFTDIVMACGSGGTTAGIGLGCHLAKTGIKVHAYGVCDDPAYFYDYCQEILDGMGATADAIGARSKDLFTALQAKGSGYAISTREELGFVKEVAETTGVILDPVYSGKALYQFTQDVLKDPSKWLGKKVLFLHTGGLLGMYDKSDQLLQIMDPAKQRRMQVEEKKE